MSDAPKQIEAGVARQDGQLVRLTLIVDGKPTVLVLERHVAAALAAQLCEALV